MAIEIGQAFMRKELRPNVILEACLAMAKFRDRTSSYEQGTSPVQRHCGHALARSDQRIAARDRFASAWKTAGSKWIAPPFTGTARAT
jgi:hypothetical protein